MAQQYRHQDQLKNARYRNWVKAGLGLKYVKEGLEDSSEDEVKEQQHDILNAVKQKHRFTTIGCGRCSLRTLQPDHVRDKYKRCPLGSKDCNCQYPGGKIACQNNVCGAIYDQIILNHASNPPAPCWKNTDVQKWCTDAWEVAKCYINAPGYASKSNASEIDCTGLLHLFINSRFLQTKIQCRITGQDVFSKTRSARNSIFHSNSMEMEDSEVNGYVDDMIAVLEDGKELINRPESIAAVKKLKELKNTNFVISSLTEDEVIREALSEINLKETELKETVENATNEMQRSKAETLIMLNTANEELKVKAQQNIDMFETSGNDIKKDIELQGLKAADKLNAKVEAKTEDCQMVIRKRKLEACNEIENVKKAAIETIEKTYDKISQEESLKQLTNTKKRTDNLKIEELCHQEVLKYAKSKEDLKKSLIEMYTENVVNISPILLQPEHTDVPVNELYIDPLIKILPISQKEKNEKGNEPKPLLSYRDIFREGDKQHKLIYLIGEAGSGKSTFCINLINNWCVAHSGHQGEESENIQEMKQYEFLFYLPLRQEIHNDHVEEMTISLYDDPVIKEILKKEPDVCLILLDGLDEWVLEATQKSPFQSKGLPRRDLKKAYTIITTSRPWKFESVGMKNTEIHRKLQLHGINNIKTMAKKTIDTLNGMFKTRKNVSDFEKDLDKYKIDLEMTSKPMVLQQLICLWFDGKMNCIGQTAIYSNILSLFFEWTNQNNTYSDVLKELREKRSSMDRYDIPEQCQAIDLCPELKYVIKHIGRLAYAALFTTRKESSLTFDESIFKRLRIPDEVISYCLKSGIISQQRSISLSLSRRQHLSFSFVHKSMQEFLCAMYIFSELKQRSPHLFKAFILHTIDKKIICFHEYFRSCKTAVDILEQSNVFIFLCGFDTYLAAHISKFVYNIVVADDSFINYRSNVAQEPFEMFSLTQGLGEVFAPFKCHGHRVNLSSIQNLLFTLIHEANIHVAVPGKLFFLSDFGYSNWLIGEVDLTLIKYINTAFVLSLNIDIGETSFQPSLCDFLNDTFFRSKNDIFEIIFFMF